MIFLQGPKTPFFTVGKYACTQLKDAPTKLDSSKGLVMSITWWKIQVNWNSRAENVQL